MAAMELKADADKKGRQDGNGNGGDKNDKAGKTERVFDLTADPVAIGEHLSGDPDLAPLVAARPGVQALAPTPRVLAPPHMAKPGIDLKLCTLDGRAEATFVPRRDKPAYAIARRLDWGDALPGE